MKKRTLSLALALALCLGLTVPALAVPQSSYTSAGGYTVNVARAPAALTDTHHRGEGIFVKEENNTYTFYDVKGNTLGTGSGYTLMGHFHDGRAPVRAYNAYTAEEAYGYIDRTGAVVIPAQFDNANVFNSGRALVKQGGQQFYIDTAGNRAIPGNFLEYNDFSDGIAVVAVPAQYTGSGSSVGEKHSQLIDINGNVLYDFPAEWHDSTGFFGGPGTYQRDTVSAIKFILRDGWLPIRDEQDKLALMDKTGARRPLPELNGAELIAYLGSNRLLVQKNAMRAIIDLNGTMLLPYLYSYIDLRCEDNFRYGVTRLSNSGTHGIIDSAGNMVVPADWGGSIDEIVDGMAIGWEWDYTGTVTKNTYLFWTSDCPYAPGASGQKPADPEPTTPPATGAEDIPASGTAVASTQSVEVDGKKVEFQMYALLDANGNGTNYVKLRDMAYILNGTKAQFAIGYSNETGITVTTGQPYAANGSEMNTPFSGDRAYTGGGQSVQINGKAVTMTAINLLDDQGGGYNYFKLRDLGAALGFNVGWTAERGVYIETDKPYTK